MIQAKAGQVGRVVTLVRTKRYQFSLTDHWLVLGDAIVASNQK